jgi:hypothetical protein
MQMMPPDKMAELGELMASAAAATIAAGIVDMLREDISRMSNERTDSALTSFERNQKAPGVWHAIETIEKRFGLKREQT